MVGRGKVEPFDGDLDDYQKYLLEESKRLREEAKEATNKPPVQKAPAPLAPERKQQLTAQTKPLKKTLAQTEERMGQLQTQKTTLENALLTLKLTGEIVQASKDLDAVNAELEDLEIKWLDVSEQIQRIESNTTAA
jgi:ATP-binding cassette subfamily F protein 3